MVSVREVPSPWRAITLYP